jgi:hypothetical protein
MVIPVSGYTDQQHEKSLSTVMLRKSFNVVETKPQLRAGTVD